MFKRLADSGGAPSRSPSTASRSRRAPATRSPRRCSPPASIIAARTPVTGAPRAPYCLMGVCFDCLVTIDGVGNRQGCLVAGARGHGGRDPARHAARPDDDRGVRSRRRPTTSSSSAAGPAGLAAATLAARAGLSTVLFDENPGAGGQIYRAITSTPVNDRAILGEDYWDGRDAGRRGQGERRADRHRRHGLEPRSRTRIVGVSIARQGAR